MEAICDDFTDEAESLAEVLAGAAEGDFDRPTPAAGWMVRDQISHLWFFDQRALLALTDPDGFAVDAKALMAAGGTEASIQPGRSMPGETLMERWHGDRARLIDVARSIDPSTRVPWYGPAMGARSFITARLMETWAHGQDVVDALDATREPTHRLRHVSHIGVRARPFSYAINQMEMPDADIRVELEPPGGGDGERWTWGAADAVDRVTGPALDFCLVVTQRRHRDDANLYVTGDAANEWISIAQAFAGDPGTGRRPGQFASP